MVQDINDTRFDRRMSGISFEGMILNVLSCAVLYCAVLHCTVLTALYQVRSVPYVPYVVSLRLLRYTKYLLGGFLIVVSLQYCHPEIYIWHKYVAVRIDSIAQYSQNPSCVSHFVSSLDYGLWRSARQ